MYIDTHCHLSNDDYDDIDEVILENRKAGIEKIIISGCTMDSIKESLELSFKYDDVYLTIGFHPSEADLVSDFDLSFLENHLKEKKVVGIGEIGLDYHYGKENMEKQKELFIRQMMLADKYHLPVVVHSRDAFLDTITILKQFPNVIGDIHCFNGSLECAREYLSIGYFLGIGGVLTFKNCKLFEVIEKIGLDCILLETDSPYLTPEPFRGKKNSSKYISFVSKKIGDILDIKQEEVALKTSYNANRLFDFY